MLVWNGASQMTVEKEQRGVNMVVLKKGCLHKDMSCFLAVFHVVIGRINLLNIEFKI